MKWTSRDSRSSLATMIGALQLPGCGQRRGKLRPPVERVSPLARLDLGEGLGQSVALSFGEAGERRLLALSRPRPDRP